MSLKLGLDENASIRFLVGDNLHQCNLLISKTYLQEHGLSDLGPKGTYFPLLIQFYLIVFIIFMCTNQLYFLGFKLGLSLKDIQEREDAALDCNVVEVERIYKRSWGRMSPLS